MNKYDNKNIIYISEPNNIIIYPQFNNFSDYTKIQNSHFYQFYNKNVQECNLYYKHIINIVKKSNRIISTQILRKSFLQKQFNLTNFIEKVSNNSLKRENKKD